MIGGMRQILDFHGDKITAERIFAAEDRLEGYDIFCFPILSSTNVTLRSLAEDDALSGTVVIAEGQTEGKGTKGRSFCSPRGKGIYLSVLFRPQIGMQALSLVTPFVAVVVARAIERVSGVAPDVKWVNDLFFGGRKLGGILTETSISSDGRLRYVIVGIGVNVLSAQFSDELSRIAVSIEEVSGKKVDRSTLIAAMLSELSPLLHGELPQNLIEDYRRRCAFLGTRVSVTRGNERFTALAETIDEDGALVVVRDDGERERLLSGEVTLLRFCDSQEKTI